MSKNIISDKEEICSTTNEIEENKYEKNLIIKMIVTIIIVLLIVICGKFLYNKLKDNTSVSGVRKLLNIKYTDISCVNTDCNGFIVIDGDKLSKYKVLLYNSKGKKVADYKAEYNGKDKFSVLPIDIADDFYISSVTDLKKLKIVNYIVKNSKNKTILKTDNSLSILNDNLILMEKNGKYTLFSKKGKKIYNNISSLNSYIDAKYIVIKIDNSYSILDSKGKKLLGGYKISKIINDEYGKEVFAIIKSEKDNIYNYYDLEKNKIMGDSFNSYTESDNFSKIIITKRENEQDIKYLLKENGKQEKIDEDLINFKDKLKDKIDLNLYKLYDSSIYDNNQKYVLVDNISDKSFGSLKINDNKYYPIYNYKSNKKDAYSKISKLKSVNNISYFKISCSSLYCDSAKSLVYDLDENKEVYNSSKIGVISKYTEYKDGYKVVKLSSDNQKYNSKYVIYDKNNNELLVSDDNVIIIDKKLIVGTDSSYSLKLYSAKKEKLLNDILVSAVKIGKDKIYKYEDSNNNIILNSHGEEVINLNKDNYLNFSEDSYVFIKDNKINVYNVNKDKTYTYKLKNNEKLNNESGAIISPYRNIIFVNNTTDDYIKILDFKANKIKKIDKAHIYSVKVNSSNNKAFIIVKKKSKKTDMYGLYVAE